MASPAQAVPLACGSHEELISHLDIKYHESRAGMGLSTDGSLIELYVSEEGGTWTLVLTSPGGTSCLINAGDNWEEVRIIKYDAT